MKKKVFVFIFIFCAMISLACIPTPYPTPTPKPPTASKTWQNTKTATNIPPTQTATFIVPSFTNTPQKPTDTATIVIPSKTNTSEPTITNTATSLPTQTFVPTLTLTNTKPPVYLTETPIPTGVFTPQYVATPLTCKSDNSCDILLDVDTLLDPTHKVLRIRFWNWGLYSSSLYVKITIGSYTAVQNVVMNPKSTGETVFEIPCIKDTHEIKVETIAPSYKSLETIDYPDCICSQ